MTSDGSPHTRLRRAIQAGNLAIIHVTAAELGYVTLRDALGILLVIESEAEERFDAAAVRWAGRLALETPDLELAELRGAWSRWTRCPTNTPNACCSGWPNVPARSHAANGEHTRALKPCPPRNARCVFVRRGTVHAAAFTSQQWL